MVHAGTYSSCYISLVTAKLFVCTALVKCPSLQDGKAIEHQTPPSGDTCAVVDKPKRESLEKIEPDLVPPGSGGVSHCMHIHLAVGPLVCVLFIQLFNFVWHAVNALIYIFWVCL